MDKRNSFPTRPKDLLAAQSPDQTCSPQTSCGGAEYCTVLLSNVFRVGRLTAHTIAARGVRGGSRPLAAFRDFPPLSVT